MGEDLIFSVAFGPAAPPIAEQLSAQGVHSDHVETFERVRENITFLNLHGYIADGAAMGARNKLMRNLKKNARRAASPDLSSAVEG